jgi:hypothetical protein
MYISGGGTDLFHLMDTDARVPGLKFMMEAQRVYNVLLL